MVTLSLDNVFKYALFFTLPLNEYIYFILSTISLESHFRFTFSRLISFIALGHSSVNVVTDKIQY